MLGVSEAAEELGVSSRRVRQMLADGVLVGERVGHSWVIDSEDVKSAVLSPREVGRPWSAASAWAVLALADGRGEDLSPVERSRARARLANGCGPILGRLGARAVRRSFYAHPGVVSRLNEAPEVVRGGVSAGADLGVDIIAPGEMEGYARADDLAGLVRFALVEQTERSNVVLRVVEDSVWPFRKGQDHAGRTAVAVDLLESDDPRSRRAGSDLLRSE